MDDISNTNHTEIINAANKMLFSQSSDKHNIAIEKINNNIKLLRKHIRQ